jgi:inner membrane protein
MDALLALFAQVQPWHWFAIGLILLIGEMSTGTSHLLWPAVGAALTGVAMLIFPIGLPAQVGVFGVATIVLALTGRTYVKGLWLNRGGYEELNDRGLQMIGQIGIAAEPFVAGIGRIKIGDSMWRAASDAEIAAGQEVEIVGVEGTTVRVRPSVAA